MQRMFPHEQDELTLATAREIVFKVISHKVLKGNEVSWKVYWASEEELIKDSLAWGGLSSIFACFISLVLAFILHPLFGAVVTLSILGGFVLSVGIIGGVVGYKYTEYKIRKKRDFCVLVPNGFVVYEQTEDHRYIAFEQITEILIGTNTDSGSLGKLWVRKGNTSKEFPFPDGCKVNVEEVKAAFDRFLENSPRPKESNGEEWTPEDHLYRNKE